MSSVLAGFGMPSWVPAMLNWPCADSCVPWSLRSRRHSGDSFALVSLSSDRIIYAVQRKLPCFQMQDGFPGGSVMAQLISIWTGHPELTERDCIVHVELRLPVTELHLLAELDTVIQSSDYYNVTV